MPVKIWSTGGGSGKAYSITSATNLQLSPDDGKVTISWTDPNDLLWLGTKVIRKAGSYPNSITDGVVVVDSKVKNQYKVTGFEDTSVVNDTEYFYSVFAYSKGGYALPVSASATPMSFSNVLSENTWKQISKASEMGIASTLWSVGDEIDVQIAGGTYTFQIYGFDHDDKADDSGKAGITFGMKGIIYDTNATMNSTQTNTGSWRDSRMRVRTFSNYYKNMQSDVKAVIKTVNKITGQYNNGTNITTQDNLFLFAEKEVGLAKYSTSNERNQLSTYPIFTDDSSRIKGNYWKLRSPDRSDSSMFCIVTNKGTADAGVANNNTWCIVIGFCV